MASADEISIRKEQLCDLFRVYQKVVDDYALDSIGALKGQAFEKTQTSRSDAWADNIWRLELSIEFTILAKRFEEFRLIHVHEGDSGTKALFDNPFDGIFSDGFDNWREWDAEDSFRENWTAFGLWGRASGFYERKLSHVDLFDWTGKFEELLDILPTDLGKIRCCLSTNIDKIDVDVRLKGLAFENLNLSDAQLFDGLANSGRELDSFWSHAMELDEHFGGAMGLWYGEIMIDRADLGDRITIVKEISFQEYWSSQKDEDQKRFFYSMFDAEKTALSIAIGCKLELEFASACSKSLLEPIFFVKAFHEDTVVTNEFVPRGLRYERDFRRVLRTCVRPVLLAKLFNYLLEVISEGILEKVKLAHSTALFVQSCSLDHELSRFVTLISTLESLLAPEASSDIGTKLAERLAKLVPEPAKSKAGSSLDLKELYGVRNRIFHKGELLSDRELSDINEQLSGICRQTLITSLLVLDGLRRDQANSVNSVLLALLESKGRPIPSTSMKLTRYMGEFEVVDGFWSGVRDTANRSAARIGYPLEKILFLE